MGSYMCFSHHQLTHVRDTKQQVQQPGQQQLPKPQVVLPCTAGPGSCLSLSLQGQRRRCKSSIPGWKKLNLSFIDIVEQKIKSRKATHLCPGTSPSPTSSGFPLTPWRITKYVSKPRAAFTTNLSGIEAARREGSQRDSRESINRKMRSCEVIKSLSFSKAALTSGSVVSLTGWPGIGIDKTWPELWTPGQISDSRSAAASAL